MSGSEDGTSRLDIEKSISFHGRWDEGFMWADAEGIEQGYISMAAYRSGYNGPDHMDVLLADARRLRDWLNSQPLGGE